MSSIPVTATAVLGLMLTLGACDSGTDSNQNQSADNQSAEKQNEKKPVADLKGLEAIKQFIEQEGIAAMKQNDGWRTKLPQPPTVAFEDGKTYFWNLETSQGPIKVELLPKVAPMHVSSTMYLTELGYYDDLKFHRVITGFMAQGGCPNTAPDGAGRAGTGGPGYQYAGEFDDAVRHDRAGLLSMANAGPGTDGSQFFLTFTATPHLDDKHTILGRIVDGVPTLRKLESRGSRSGTPTEELALVKSTITVE